MKKKLLYFLLIFCCCIPLNANAINTDTSVYDAWGFYDSLTMNESYGEFILDGGIGKVKHGTHGDEYAVAAVIATKIVDHGGYFCPYQFQCANKRKNMKSWSVYYFPTGYSSDKCFWLCEAGYSGENCEPSSGATVNFCKTDIMGPKGTGVFSDIRLKTSGGDTDGREGDITGFSSWQAGDNKGIRRNRDWREYDVLLGAIKFLEHGIIAQPIRLECRPDDWKEIVSWVESINAGGTKKLLCAEGYTANDSGTDCVAIDQEICDIQNVTLCANFPKDKFNSVAHDLKKIDGEACTKYFCVDGKGFQSAGDPTCVDCGAPAAKSGPNLTNGTCLVCDTGQYYDSADGTCKTANAFSKTELQYGPGQTRNTNFEVDNQCWYKTTPDDYKTCITGFMN